MKQSVSEQFLAQAKPLIGKLQNGMLVLQHSDRRNPQIIYANDIFLELVGYSLAELLEITKDSLSSIVFLPDFSKFCLSLERSGEESEAGITYRLATKNGASCWVLAHHKKAIINGESYIFITFTNIQDLMGTQLELEANNNQWQDIVNSVPIGFAIFSIENGSVSTLSVNQPLIDFSNELGMRIDGNFHGWTREQLMLTFNQNLFCFCVEEDVPLVQALLEESILQEVSQCRFRLNGSTEDNPIWIFSKCHSRPLTATRRNYYVTFQDVTNEVAQEKELQKSHSLLLSLSYHDSLTGVKNRHSYESFINHCKSNRQSNVGIAFADINGLKTINDSLGHIYGDRMILDFVALLIHEFTTEHIYRISGDEFVIIEPEISKADFFHKIERIQALANERGSLASIGYIWKEKVSDIRRRTDQAEQLMYVEKQKYYEAQKNATSKHRPKLLNQLLSDMENGNFVMYLQPKSMIANSTIVGAEALVRKIEDDGRIVAPYEFIPQLEQLRLIPKIDYFILEEACRLLERLDKQNRSKLKISVNMSRVTLAENDYIEQIEAICSRYCFPHEHLEFEITESNKTMDTNRLEEAIQKLRSFGFGVSLDDVGTEYSSFPMLTLEGIDTVKLDRSFIIQVNQPKARKLVKHIVDMCHDLGLSVIAEGVETDEHRALLQTLDCDMYQGYLLSKPIPVEDFLERLS